MSVEKPMIQRVNTAETFESRKNSTKGLTLSPECKSNTLPIDKMKLLREKISLVNLIND